MGTIKISHNNYFLSLETMLNFSTFLLFEFFLLIMKLLSFVTHFVCNYITPWLGKLSFGIWLFKKITTQHANLNQIECLNQGLINLRLHSYGRLLSLLLSVSFWAIVLGSDFVNESIMIWMNPIPHSGSKIFRLLILGHIRQEGVGYSEKGLSMWQELTPNWKMISRCPVVYLS